MSLQVLFMYIENNAPNPKNNKSHKYISNKEPQIYVFSRPDVISCFFSNFPSKCNAVNKPVIKPNKKVKNNRNALGRENSQKMKFVLTDCIFCNITIRESNKTTAITIILNFFILSLSQNSYLISSKNIALSCSTQAAA